jgi:hypothetical protein
MDIKKKYYISPELVSVMLDNEVSLTEPSAGLPPGSAAPVDRDKPSFGPSSVAPTSTSNPFGGSHPDYGDM